MIIMDVQADTNFSQQSAKVQREVKKTVVRLVLKLLRKVKQDKLSGQVLNVRTGRLRRSINQRVTESEGRIDGLVGTNVEYARAHELGFTGSVTVKEHMRLIKKAWGHSIKPKQVEVKSHSRAVKFPEKSFLQSALREMQPEIMTELQDAVGRGIA